VHSAASGMKFLAWFSSSRMATGVGEDMSTGL
jgi:hypothetical protein